MVDLVGIEQLARELRHIDDVVVAQAAAQNEWFTESNIRRAGRSIADEFLCVEKLAQWLARYDGLPVAEPARVMVVTAGNIPMVGFFDLFCAVLAGHRVLLKPSSRDRVLMCYAANLLNKYLGAQVEVVDTIDNSADALLFMGSDSTAEVLLADWADKPHVIRSHRISVALLSGVESDEQLERLADDVFAYFGLGCRNVTNIFVPQDFDAQRLVRAFNRYDIGSDEYCAVVRRQKARLAVCCLPFVAGEFFLFKDGFSTDTLMGEVRLCRYESEAELQSLLNRNEEHIQCVVSENVKLPDWKVVDFGQAQKPALDDFPDRCDTMIFLQKIVTFAET